MDGFAKEADNSTSVVVPKPVENNEDEPDACAGSWRAAADKGAWGVFKENGIFASACRHGLVLWVSDMIQTGESFVLCLPALSWCGHSPLI